MTTNLHLHCLNFSFQLNAVVLEIVDAHQKQRKKLEKPYLEPRQKIIQGNFTHFSPTLKWGFGKNEKHLNDWTFADAFPKVMTMQRIRHPFLRHHVGRSEAHLMEPFRHAHPFNMMQFHVAAKLALLSHHIDNHTEGDSYANIFPLHQKNVLQNHSVNLTKKNFKWKTLSFFLHWITKTSTG